jgi:hypothetical protein
MGWKSMFHTLFREQELRKRMLCCPKSVSVKVTHSFQVVSQLVQM